MSIQTRYALPTLSSGGIPEDEDMEDIVDSFPPDDLFHFIPQEQLSSAGPSSVPLQSHAGPPGPSSQSSSSASRPQGSRRVLDDDDDARVVEEHPHAGQVIRMNPTLHERWKQHFAKSDAADAEGDVEMREGSDADSENAKSSPLFYPFASQLDWQIADWFVREQPGHKSFDRLLQIPGVSELRTCYGDMFQIPTN